MRFDGNVYYHELEPDFPRHKMLDEWREMAKLYDEAGFTGVWFGEHHFWHKGWIVAVPNPILIGCMLAENTKRLRVAQSACVLPDWHPLRLAEDIAELDQITKGRVDVGIARGTNTSCSLQFNISADRRDQERNWALFKECLEILIKAWTEDEFTYEGEFFQFPVPGWTQPDPRIVTMDPTHYAPDGELIAFEVTPKPYQKPYPPIWQAADNTPSFAFAAERGHSVLSFGRSFEGLQEAWHVYKETASRVHGREIPLGRTPDGRGLAVMRTVYVAETMEQAEKEARAGLNLLFGYLFGYNPTWGRKGSLATGQELTEEDLNDDWFDFLQRHEIILVGSPDYVAEKIEKLRSELGCEHFTVWPNPQGLPFEKVLHSLELFAQHVIPRFQPVEVS